MLGRLPGVMKAKADHKTQKVHLTLDLEKLSVQEVTGKLADMGYEAAPSP